MDDEPESDESMTEDDSVPEPHVSNGDDTGQSKSNATSTEQTAAEVPFVCDAVHEQAYSELEDAGVNVEQALGDRLHQAFEKELYQMRQEFKYGGGGQR